MKKNILICLDLIKHPFSGMGRVSADFSAQLSKTDDFEYSFLIPPGHNISYLNGKDKRILNMFRKFSSGYMRHYDICHVLHQLPKFSFRKAKKVVLTVHDLNYRYTKSSIKQKKYKRIVQTAINKADYICFISEFTKNECFRYLQVPDHVPTAVIYNGVNDLPAPSKQPEWCPKDEFLFSIGQFLTKKNFHVLIPFLKMLPENVSLVIAGQNQTGYGKELKVIIKEFHLEKRVILPGSVSEEEKSFLYQHCKAFVFPSIAEGFGLPVIEAMKCRKPVFCSDRTSLKEIGNRYAFFWHDFEPEQMLNVFEKGMAKFETDETFKEEQLKYANSYTWEKNVSEYIKIYQKLL